MRDAYLCAEDRLLGEKLEDVAPVKMGMVPDSYLVWATVLRIPFGAWSENFFAKAVISLGEYVRLEEELASEEWDESDFQIQVRKEEARITKGINRKSKLKAVEKAINGATRKERAWKRGKRVIGCASDPGRGSEDRGGSDVGNVELRNLQASATRSGTGGYLTR